MVRPTIRAVAATVSTAVIQRRMRRVRVIAVSFTRCVPRSADHWRFEAAALTDGAAAPGRKTPARTRPAMPQRRQAACRCTFTRDSWADDHLQRALTDPQERAHRPASAGTGHHHL